MKIIFLVVLLFFWSPISAEVRPEYSGMWYNPDQDGHGLSLEVLDAERSVGFWYRYDESGEPEWWLLKGTNHAATTEFGPHMKLEAHRFHGMIPGDWNPATNTRVHVTDLVVEFHDCNHITVYDVWAAPAIDMIRLTNIAGLHCGYYDPPSLEALVGDWMVSINNLDWDAVPTTVTPEGAFEFVWDDFACSWRGQIGFEIAGVPMFHVMVTEKDPGCGEMLYSTEYAVLHREHTICFRPSAQCKDYDEVLEFEICDGDFCGTFPDLVLYRDLPK